MAYRLGKGVHFPVRHLKKPDCQAQTAAKMRLIAEGRWRKRDSNSRSLREGKGYGEPLQPSIAVSGLNLVSGSAFRAAVSEWQERDRWFESGSLQQRVSNELFWHCASMEPLPRCLRRRRPGRPSSLFISDNGGECCSGSGLLSVQPAMRLMTSAITRLVMASRRVTAAGASSGLTGANGPFSSRSSSSAREFVVLGYSAWLRSLSGSA